MRGQNVHKIDAWAKIIAPWAEKKHAGQNRGQNYFSAWAKSSDAWAECEQNVHRNLMSKRTRKKHVKALKGHAKTNWTTQHNETEFK